MGEITRATINQLNIQNHGDGIFWFWDGNQNVKAFNSSRPLEALSKPYINDSSRRFQNGENQRES